MLMAHLGCCDVGGNKKKMIKERILQRQGTVAGTSERPLHNAACQYVLLLFHVQLQRAGRRRPTFSLPPFMKYNVYYFLTVLLKGREGGGETESKNYVPKATPKPLRDRKLLSTSWSAVTTAARVYKWHPTATKHVLNKAPVLPPGTKLFNFRLRLQPQT